MSIASEPKHCPKCQAPLPGDAPQGLCPKCLLAAASIPTEADQPAPDKTPPNLAELAAAFPQLEILKLIGQGGMGFVFKARQPKLDRFVALKILPQSLAAAPAFAERFSREGRVLAKLNHPNIVTIHDFGQANGFFYLLMEFVDGVNLRQAMRAGRFTPDQALAIVPKICEALQFAHNEGILHRDIKPENILLDAKGRVKIADFGIAKLVAAVCDRRDSAENDLRRSQTAATENLTEAGKTLGTPNYMAPEQRECSGEVDHRADIYSLGVVFYEMLTGELPLGRFAPPSQKSAADPRVDEVVLRALEKEKAKRYASAEEVKTQVETIAATPDFGGRRGDESQTEKQSQSLLTSSPTSVEPRFSPTALFGAVLGVTFAMTGIPFHFMLVKGLVFPGLFTLLFTACGMTLCGWVSVVQIRRSAGKLHGLWLAVFDGLLFPLLALDALIGWWLFLFFDGFARHQHPGGAAANPMGVLIISIPIMLMVDWLIIRRVWRAVNQPMEGILPTKFSSRPRDESQTERPNSQGDLGKWAFGLFLFGTLGLFLLALVSPSVEKSPVVVLLFGGFALLLALMLGIMGWRERLGKFTAIATGMTLVIAGVVILFVLPAKEKMVAKMIGQRQRDDLELVRQRFEQHQLESQRIELNFSPVVERVVSDSKDPIILIPDGSQARTNSEVLINFDSGELFVGAGENWAVHKMMALGGRPEQYDNNRALGISAKLNGVVGIDTAISPVDNQKWDEISANLIAEKFYNADTSGLERFPAQYREPLPLTWLFRTHEGTMGILQITGFTDNPSGVKLRYKLVHPIQK